MAFNGEIVKYELVSVVSLIDKRHFVLYSYYGEKLVRYDGMETIQLAEFRNYKLENCEGFYLFYKNTSLCNMEVNNSLLIPKNNNNFSSSSSILNKNNTQVLNTILFPLSLKTISPFLWNPINLVEHAKKNIFDFLNYDINKNSSIKNSITRPSYIKDGTIVCDLAKDEDENKQNETKREPSSKISLIKSEKTYSSIKSEPISPSSSSRSKFSLNSEKTSSNSNSTPSSKL